MTLPFTGTTIQPSRGPDLVVPIFDAPYNFTPQLGSLIGQNTAISFNPISLNAVLCHSYGLSEGSFVSNYQLGEPLGSMQLSVAFALVRLTPAYAEGTLQLASTLAPALTGGTYEYRCTTEDGFVSALNWGPTIYIGNPPYGQVPNSYSWSAPIAPSPGNVILPGNPYTPIMQGAMASGYPQMQGPLQYLNEQFAQASQFTIKDIYGLSYNGGLFQNFNTNTQSTDPGKVCLVQCPLMTFVPPFQFCNPIDFGFDPANPNSGGQYIGNSAGEFVLSSNWSGSIGNIVTNVMTCLPDDSNQAYYKIYQIKGTPGAFSSSLSNCFARASLVFPELNGAYPAFARTWQCFPQGFFCRYPGYPGNDPYCGSLIYITNNGLLYGRIILQGQTANAIAAINNLSFSQFDGGTTVVTCDYTGRWWIASQNVSNAFTYIGMSNILDLSFNPVTLANLPAIDLSCANCPPLGAATVEI